jgi:hypothetical protein
MASAIVNYPFPKYGDQPFINNLSNASIRMKTRCHRHELSLLPNRRMFLESLAVMGYSLN